MRYNRATRYAILIVLATLAPVLTTNLVPRVHAATYSLGTIPFMTQEGSTITYVFTVSGAAGGTFYSFRFFVRDPASNTHESVGENYTTLPGQTEFTLPPFYYPTSSFPGPNSLVGQYITWANQVLPGPTTTVAATYFLITLTDKTQYQRTETVNIQATGYKPSEVVNIKIVTGTTTTTVFTHTLTASTTGVVVDNWKIPRNATIDSRGYVLFVNGTLTVKTPADAQGFNITPASMTISTLASAKSTYQRTETMSFSFQPLYPDGTSASTGVALLTLTRPDRTNNTLTTTYSSGSQTFNATYKTSVDNETGTWIATLASNGYADAYGNTGPSTTLSSSVQLSPATLAMNVIATSLVPVGQPVKFNATITYPDGTELQTGVVGAYLVFTGSPSQNDTVPVIFDTGLQMWVGSYTPQPSDPGGLWSLIVKASDSSAPPNAGSATRAITLQDKPPVVSLALSTASVKIGQSVTLTISASDPDGTVSTIMVDWGDGTVDSLSGAATTDSHIYTSTGGAGSKTYTVTVTATDNGAQTTSSTSSVTVAGAAPPPGGTLSLPLYYFGILAALIAAMLVGGFLALRRHRVTHAKLKIDLEAVKSEAGRIENQEFFQSVKDQLRKDKDD